MSKFKKGDIAIIADRFVLIDVVNGKLVYHFSIRKKNCYFTLTSKDEEIMNLYDRLPYKYEYDLYSLIGSDYSD